MKRKPSKKEAVSGPVADFGPLASLESIAKSVVLADHQDLQGLAAIHTQVFELAGLTADAEVGAKTAAMADLIEKIILGETNDPAAALASLGDTIAKLRDHLRDLKSAETPSEASPSQIPADSSPPSLPENVDDEILQAFLSRQPSVLETMEETILAHEKDRSPEKLAELRRLIHTLKGEAGVLGFCDVELLCHRIEDSLEKGDAGADCLLSVKDWLAKFFEAVAGKCEAPGPVECLFDRLTGSCAVTEPSFAPVDMANAPDRDLIADFIAEAQEHLHNADSQLLVIENNPDNAEAINTVFRAFHTIKGVAGCINLQAITKLAHASENLLDKARKNEIKLEGSRIDIIFTATDRLKHEIAVLHDAFAKNGSYAVDSSIGVLIRDLSDLAAGRAAGRDSRKLGEILVSSGKISSKEIKEALAEQVEKPGAKIGELLIERGVVNEQDITKALSRQHGEVKAVQVRETVKVDTERLDRLVDIIGELVIAESVVTGDEELIGHASARVIRNMRQLDKITRELQAIGMSMRLVSIKSTFQKMARLVRDLAKKSGKEINFVTEGEETELDKTVIDNIGDPLVHMIRNSADHGVEMPEDREKAGKPRTGTICLRAFHKGGNIHIEIEDDGKGLDKEAILSKARNQNLIRENEELSEQQIFQLIFKPGFSTAKVVTDVSGRGVGMDVVKRNIEALRGVIEIKSVPGRGTVFSIHLPLTMAIMDGMVVKVGCERYIIPTLSVIESVRPKPEDLSKVLGKGEMVNIHNELIPLFRIANLFSIGDAQTDPLDAVVMVVEDAGVKVGIMIDRIVGQQQTVIKTLGQGMGKIPGVSGGAIMTDGCISLILDVGGIVRMAGEAA